MVYEYTTVNEPQQIPLSVYCLLWNTLFVFDSSIEVHTGKEIGLR